MRTKQRMKGASSRLVSQELQCNVTEAKIRNCDLKVNRTNMLGYSGKSRLISKVCIFTACLTVCLYHPRSSTTYIKVQVTERELPLAIILLLFIIAAPELSTHPDLWVNEWTAGGINTLSLGCCIYSYWCAWLISLNVSFLKKLYFQFISPYITVPGTQVLNLMNPWIRCSCFPHD